MAPDEKDGGGPRIIFQGQSSEYKELSAQETSTSGVVDGTENENSPASEYFRSLLSGATFTWISVSSLVDEDTGDTVEGEDELAEASGGMC